MGQLVSFERVLRRIFIIRRQRVMLSTDLAGLYGVEPKVLVQAVKRNLRRFPEDFMFQLSRDELAQLVLEPATSSAGGGNLKSQIVTSSWGGSRKPPFAFTEQGVAMLSSVLKSDRAVQVNVAIMRAFVHLRDVLAGNRELARRLTALERHCDARFRVVFQALEGLANPEVPARRRIGFAAPQRSEVTTVSSSPSRSSRAIASGAAWPSRRTKTRAW